MPLSLNTLVETNLPSSVRAQSPSTVTSRWSPFSSLPTTFAFGSAFSRRTAPSTLTYITRRDVFIRGPGTGAATAAGLWGTATELEGFASGTVDSAGAASTGSFISRVASSSLLLVQAVSPVTVNTLNINRCFLMVNFMNSLLGR